MFDTTTLGKRFFTINFEVEHENGNEQISLEIEPPKLKVVKKLQSLLSKSENPIDDLIDAMVTVFNKNRSGFIVNADIIESSFDIFEMVSFLQMYFDWVGEISKNPNL